MSITYEPATIEKTREQQRNSLHGITLEHGLYFLIIVVAAILRLVNLNSPPLSLYEAQEALPIWDLWQASTSSSTIGSPIYFSLTGLAALALGFANASMRLIPVLFGLGLVVLPWFLRHRNGRVGSLAVTLLLAVSPTLTFASRTAGGQSAALFAGLLIFIAWLRFQESQQDIWFYVLIIALSVGLASDALFYGILLALLLAWLAQTTLGPALIRDENGQRIKTRFPDRSTVKKSLLLGLGLILLVATAFTLRSDGIGATADLATQFLARFVLQAGSFSSWISPFFAIARYELIIMLIGLPAIYWAIRSDRAYPLLLIYWSLGGIFVLLLQRDTIANVLLITLPLYLLIGTFVDSALAETRDWRDLSFALVILFAGIIIYVNLGRYGRLAATNLSVAGSYNVLIAIATLIVAIILMAFIWSWDGDIARKSTVAGLFALLITVSWSTAWWMAGEGANDTREIWITAASDDDLPLLGSTIEQLSWLADNSERGVHIYSSVDSPVLRWYLREFTNLKIGGALPRTIDTPLLITTNAESPDLKAGYIGADFGHQRLDTPHQLSALETLRWWFFRESPTTVIEDRVILWLRGDLAGGTP